MPKPTWSVARIMAQIAILAVGLTALLAVRTPQHMGDAGVGVLGLVLALILTSLMTGSSFVRPEASGFLARLHGGGDGLCAAMAATFSSLPGDETLPPEIRPAVCASRAKILYRQVVAVHEGAIARSSPWLCQSQCRRGICWLFPDRRSESRSGPGGIGRLAGRPLRGRRGGIIARQPSNLANRVSKRLAARWKCL